MRYNNIYFSFWKYFFLSGIIFFTFFRILFLFINGNFEQIHMGVLFAALINGIRFDITTIGYLLLPIWILLCICSIPRFGKILRTYAIILIRYYILFAIALSTTIIILDIGFYQEYFTRINYLAFEYLEFADTILSTIYHQFPYNLLIALIPILIFLELKLVHKKLKIIPIPTFSNMSHWIASTLITLIILMIMVLLIIGVKESARFNKVMVTVKVSAILIFIAFAMFNVNPENWSPFMPFGWFETLPSGKTVGVLAGASIVFFAYVGFDAVSTAAEEAINPQRDLPKGIINSLIFCTIIYIIVAALLTGVVPYQELNVSSPVAFALAKIGFPWASALVSIGVIAGLATVMLVLYYALTRIIFAISRDGLLPSSLSSVNKKTQTPIKTILICGILISTTAGFTSLGTLAEIVNIGTLSAFVIVCLGVIFLRNNNPKDKNTFRNKWHPVVPVLGIISCSLLMIFLPIQTWIRFLIWILIGIGMYFVYSYRNSKLN